jgi:hypothetical protein
MPLNAVLVVIAGALQRLCITATYRALCLYRVTDDLESMHCYDKQHTNIHLVKPLPWQGSGKPLPWQPRLWWMLAPYEP